MEVFVSFQVFLNNFADIMVDPLPWSGFMKYLAYFSEIGRILYVINCSANFFAYQCLVSKEKKLQKERKQEREMERMNPTSSTNSTRMTSFDWIDSLRLCYILIYKLPKLISKIQNKKKILHRTKQIREHVIYSGDTGF